MTARRVLVIDDDDEVREVTRVSLEMMAGWRVSAAPSGSEGVALAAAERPEAILLDVMMPDMDGTDTVERLQGSAATRDIPVILLTAVAQDARWRRFQELGVAGMIAKPFDAIRLADQVAAMLGWDR